MFMLFSSLLSSPLLFALYALALLLSLAWHEASHALSAKLQGDRTAEQLGRLTLNPFAHVDLWGLVFLFVAGFGWGKPVPFDPRNLRNKKYGPSLVALMGPASNILLAVIFGITFKILLTTTTLHPDNNLLMVFLLLMVQLNVVLAVFNLLPIPPLDGANIFLPLLRHPRWYRLKYTLYSQGYVVLFLLVIADNYLGFRLIGRLLAFVLGLVGQLLSSG